MFKRVDFMNYWLYGFSSIALIILLNPFVTLWLGKQFTLSVAIVVALILRFFVAGQMNTLWTFRSTLGLFIQGKYRPVFAAVLNVVLSIGFSYFAGAAGVLIATVITRCCVNLWYDPWVLHRDGFQKSVKPYYVMWIKRMVIMTGIALIMMLISHFVFRNGITYLNFALMVVLVAVIPNAVLLCVYHRNPDFLYFYTLIKGVFKTKVLKKGC